MGCIWSNENERGREWNYQNSHYATRQQQTVRARFGEYRCICGRTWSSCQSWQHAYQQCSRCKRSVYAHSLRDLKPSDMSKDREDVKKHQMELCQMCQQLGQNCGSIARTKRDRSRPRRRY